MELALITNDPRLALEADRAGIDRVFIDLERLGKCERQAGRGLFLSDHSLADAARIRPLLEHARLQVRVDPWHAGSPAQIDAALAAGAGYVMLPYFQRLEHAAQFVRAVRGRALPILLVETAAAAAQLADLCGLPGLAEVHIGLNDLSLSLGKRFLFEVLLDGTVDAMCATLRQHHIPFGFGGIGSLSNRSLPVDPELILAAQVCQGATRGWLGRTFREIPADRLAPEVALLRHAIERWQHASADEQASLHSSLRWQIATEMRRRAQTGGVAAAA
jgi:hypothetical protein